MAFMSVYRASQDLRASGSVRQPQKQTKAAASSLDRNNLLEHDATEKADSLACAHTAVSRVLCPVAIFSCSGFFPAVGAQICEAVLAVLVALFLEAEQFEAQSPSSRGRLRAEKRRFTMPLDFCSSASSLRRVL